MNEQKEQKTKYFFFLCICFRKNQRFFFFHSSLYFFSLFFAFVFEKWWKTKKRSLKRLKKKKRWIHCFFKKNKQIFFFSEYTKRNHESLKKNENVNKIANLSKLLKTGKNQLFLNLMENVFKNSFLYSFWKRKHFFWKKMKRGTFFSKKSCVYFVNVAFWIFFEEKLFASCNLRKQNFSTKNEKKVSTIFWTKKNKFFEKKKKIE